MALQSKIFYRYDLIIGYTSYRSNFTILLFFSIVFSSLPILFTYHTRFLSHAHSHSHSFFIFMLACSLSTSFHKVFVCSLSLKYRHKCTIFVWGSPRSKSNIAYINDSFLWTEVSKFFGKSLKVNNQKLLLLNTAWCMCVCVRLFVSTFLAKMLLQILFIWNFCLFMRLTELIYDFYRYFSIKKEEMSKTCLKIFIATWFYMHNIYFFRRTKINKFYE